WNKDKKGCFSESTIEMIRNARMKQILPINNTKIELKMAKALDTAGIKYISQFNLDNRFLLDFAIPESKVGIECDGVYWHNLPRNKHVDKLKNIYAKKKDWILLRFTDKQINNDMQKCI